MDAFEMLGLPRRLVVPEEELRAAVRAAAARAHPDAGGDEARFATVQQAAAILTSPAGRLRHWLQLRGLPCLDRGGLPATVMDLFGTVGAAVQGAEAALRRRAAARSTLGRALCEPAVQAAREQVEQAQAHVEQALAAEVARFPAIEAGTDADPAEIARALAFLEKWRARLRAVFADLAT